MLAAVDGGEVERRVTLEGKQTRALTITTIRAAVNMEDWFTANHARFSTSVWREGASWGLGVKRVQAGSNRLIKKPPVFRGSV